MDEPANEISSYASRHTRKIKGGGERITKKKEVVNVREKESSGAREMRARF